MFSQFTGKHLCFLEKQLFKNIMNLTVPRNIPTCNISTSKEQSCCLNTQNKVKASKRGEQLGPGHHHHPDKMAPGTHSKHLTEQSTSLPLQTFTLRYTYTLPLENGAAYGFSLKM